LRLQLHITSRELGSERGAISAFSQILLLGASNEKFLAPLMRFARGDVMDHIVSSKIDHGLP
jgi:hypothetical protein